MKAKKVKASNSNKKSLQKKSPIRPAKTMPVINPHAAGIDVGSTEHWVCVPEDSVPAEESAVRSFGGFTGELDKLVEWLQACGVKTVAMESTGVYWIALAQKLEAAELEMILVNARHVKHVPGRKTDIKDCQWIQQLHSYGLLNGSFRPGPDICALRSLMRHRHNLTQSCGQEVQHMQKGLQQMNVHLHHVVSDLSGETGLHHRKAGTGLQRDLTEELKRICEVDLTQVVGINVLGVLIILSEIGLDMSRWRSAKAFCSWLGLCPGNKISGGKVLNSRTVHVVNRVAILLRTVAPAVGRSDTWLGIFHRRMRGRLGPEGANTATARKLACLIYHLLRYKEDYIDVDQLMFLGKMHKARVARLCKQAEELGFKVVKKQQAA